MKKKLPSSSISLTRSTLKLYNVYNAVFLSISMLAAGSAAANTEDFPQYEGFTLETLALKGDHVNGDLLTLTYKNKEGKIIVKSGALSLSGESATSYVITPVVSEDWDNGLICKMPCEIQVIKNGVKSKLTKNDLKKIEWIKLYPNSNQVETLKKEISDIENEIMKLAESEDLKNIKAERRLNVLGAQRAQKMNLLQYIQSFPKKTDLETESQDLKQRQRMDKLYEEGNFADPLISLGYEALATEYKQKMYLLQFFQGIPEKVVLEKEFENLFKKISRYIGDGMTDVGQDLKDPKNLAMFNIMVFEALRKQALLEFLYTPTTLDEQRVEFRLQEMREAENADVHDEFYESRYERSAYKYFWNYELLKYIQDPSREISLKNELPDLDEKLDNLSKKLDFSNPKDVARYLVMTQQYNIKIDMLQLIRWKNAYSQKS
ncbi:MAG: hypothetical protein K0R08_2176 [Solimicrobium sp.]|nr:hypothetical protein [Solimicrobium sp.]